MSTIQSLDKKLNIDFVPSSFKLQWHITERCNFHCQHCYQENYNTPEISLEQMGEILNQYVGLIKKWQIPRNKAYLSITGGEPFLREDFYQFLAKIYKHSSSFTWFVLSNGSLINRENIKILKLFNVGAVQVSLEGLEANNDKIRGKGNFKKAIEAIKLLTCEGVCTVVSFTFSKMNMDDVFSLAEFLAKIGISDFLIRRLVPRGSGSQFKDLLLEPVMLLNFYKKIHELSRQLYLKKYKMKISFGCDIPFFSKERKLEPSLLLHQQGSYCAVTNGMVLTLLPNGDILPCRRLPIVVGNVLKKSLEEIYYLPELKNLRDHNQLPEKCQGCLNFNHCFGGARCVTYAYAGRIDLPDPQCWYIQ